jgi:formylglycine-generating enzyme required for sulfatase activity
MAHFLLLAVVARAGATNIFDAARSNDVARVREFFADDPDAVHSVIGNGATPLHVAAAANAADAANALLEAGADVDARTSGGFTPLHWAANRGATATARILIGAGAVVDARAKTGLTALHWAASKNAMDVAKLLLAEGADPNAPTLDGLTPLHWAVMKNAQDCAALLAFKQVTDEIDHEPPAPPVVAPPPPPEASLPENSTSTIAVTPVIQIGGEAPFGRTLVVDIGFGETLAFVWLEPLHLWAGKYEISNGQFRRFRASHDSGSRESISLNANLQPVVNVSWHDAAAFAAWVNHAHSGSLPGDVRVRLPLSAEWQAIASCGKARTYPWGNDWPPKYGNFGDLSARRELTEWSGIRGYDDGFPVTCPVTRSGANEWGLFGMAGNVWEWCADGSDLSGKYKVRHGASWDFDQEPSMRIATQGFDRPEVHTDTIGIRLVAAPEM